MPSLDKLTRSNLLMLNWSTLKMVGLNILTLNTLIFIWLWNLIDKLGDQAEQSANRGLAIAAFALIMWGDAFSMMIDEDTLYDFPFLGFLSGVCNLAYLTIILILSFKIKPLVEEFFKKIGKPYRLNPVWCFIFPLYYQYYVIYNLDNKVKEANVNNEDQISKLTKLQALKESGAITEEEFQAQKAKILSE